MTEYPSIARKIRQTRLATTGKRGHQKTLRKMRLQSLKREVRLGLAGRG